VCAIAGVILYEYTRDDVQLSNIRSQLCHIVNAAGDRGRDSFGWSALTKHDVVSRKWTTGEKRVLEDFEVTEDTRIVICNRRAEPTTEFVPLKMDTDVQPFTDGHWFVSHNGTIANDRELSELFALKRDTRIDSAVLPGLFSKAGFEKGLREIIGSFALAGFKNERRIPQLYLACNYKPLWIAHDDCNKCIFFASLPEYLDETWWKPQGTRRLKLTEIPPYSMVRINSLGGIVYESLKPERVTKKVLVVCSGGLDSGTLATKYVKEGHKVELLHFTYGCRAEEREVVAVKAVAEALKVDVRFVDLGLLFRTLAPSKLTDPHGTSNRTSGGEAGAEFAHEWVPARNLVFMAIVTAIAEGNGFDTIALGANLEESGAYPDNEALWRRRLAAVVEVSTNVNVHIQVEAPFENLMKHEIVKLAIELKAPLEHMWSCYEGDSVQCGTCGPDQLRRMGFKMSGVIDPIEYEWLPEGFWDGCVTVEEYRNEKGV